MAEILAVLRQDHENMSRLLDVLEQQIDNFASGQRPDADIVSAIADYMLEYPDRFHHPVEDMVLGALRERDPAAANSVGALDSEHARIGKLARNFHTAVTNWLSDEPARRDDFVATARAFLAAMREHIAREDSEFFPAAEAALTRDDLDRLSSGLPKLDDPLFGAADRDSYNRLRQAIIDWSGNDTTG